MYVDLVVLNLVGNVMLFVLVSKMQFLSLYTNFELYMKYNYHLLIIIYFKAFYYVIIVIHLRLLRVQC